MSGISEEELDRLMQRIHSARTCGSWAENVRAAVNELLAKRVKAESRPMHEPVTNAEIDDFMRAISDPYGGNMTPREVTGIALDKFLARRAAATREQVVVTEVELDRLRAEYNAAPPGDIQYHGWLADRLNNRNEKPVDPRVGIVLSWANNTLGAQNVLDEDIAGLLAKMDEVKP